MSELLTICIVNYNSSEFVLNTLYCLKNLTKYKYKVIIRDNNSRLKDYLNLKEKSSKYSNVELYRAKNFNYIRGKAHGIGLNDLITKVDTKYGVILDADCTFLHKNWDEILINEINKEYPIIGTQKISTDERYGKFNFPLIYAILFKNKIMQKLNIDFTPKGQPGNLENFKDTGHELEEKLIVHGYKGKLITMKNTRFYKEGPFHKIICAEYYLDGYHEVFASHFGRGSSLGWAKYFKGWKKKLCSIPIIGAYIIKLKGRREKKNWIKICKKIVNNID